MRGRTVVKNTYAFAEYGILVLSTHMGSLPVIQL